MRRLKLPYSENTILRSSAADAQELDARNKLARENKASVLDAALTIEHWLAHIVSLHFFGVQSPRKSEFEGMILASDWCSYAQKMKLVLHIVDQQKLLPKTERDRCEVLLRKTMKYRNAFAHGKLWGDDSHLFVRYYEGKPQKQDLTDEYLAKVEKDICDAVEVVAKIWELMRWGKDGPPEHFKPKRSAV